MNRYAKHTLIGLLLIAGLLIWSLTVQAQDRCSLTMARGTYGIECGGDAPLGSDSTMLLPAVALGVVSLDGEGSVTGGMMNVSIGGMASEIEITGGEGVVNPDCSGEVAINFGDIASARIPGVILNQGAMIKAFSPIPGVTAICTLTRISLD